LEAENMKFELKLSGVRLAVAIILFISSLTTSGILLVNQNNKEPNLLIRSRKISFTDDGKRLSGPWGDLEINPITLQPPINMMTDYKSLFEASKNWNFDNANLDEIRDLFLKAGLSSEVCDLLIKNTKPVPNGGGYITSPPSGVLLGFSSDIRARLYPEIGKYKNNPTYTYPLNYSSTNPDDWFLAGFLRPDLIKRITPLIYIRNNMCCISDLHLVVPYLKTSIETENLLQVMFRSRALEVFLKIEEGQDISKLAEYWGRLGRTDEITPLLESIRNTPGGGKIDIIHLLPPIPRGRLHTFVSAKEYNQFLRNCHWLSFNFFNEQSDERVGKDENLGRLLGAITDPLPKGQQPQFGDMILIIDQNENVLHSCVYIADNLVFTKNGSAPDRPFKLSYLDDVLSLYSLDGGLTTEIFSRKIPDTNLIQL
jgi:hypothetical protein